MTDRPTATDRPSDSDADEPPRQVLRIEVSSATIWTAIGAIVATLIVIWALLQARSLVSMIIISIFFSLALQPAVAWLHRRYGWRRGAAVGVIYVAGIVGFILLILVLIPAVATIASAIGERGGEWLISTNDWLSETFGVELLSDDALEGGAIDAEAIIKEWGDDVLGAVTGIASAGISLIFNLATIALFTFYFTADAPRIQQAVLSRLQPRRQRVLGWAWDEAIIQTGGYFYSRLILMVINAFGFFFTMVAVGMPVALSIPLAMFAGFVAAFIPAVGTYIGSAVPILLTLVIQGLIPALIVLAYAIAYQQLENFWLSPKISANTMSLNGGVAFGAALAGGAIAGPMGAFMALPVAALITSFISTYSRRQEVVYHSHLEDDEEAAVAAPDQID